VLTHDATLRSRPNAARWGALALAAGVAIAPAVTGAQPRPRRIVLDSARTDSTAAFHIAVEPGDLLRMVGELMAARQTEERLAQMLREAQVTQADPGRMRDIEDQLALVAKRNAGLASVIRLQCARNDLAPDGYLGVNFLGLEVRRVADGPALYYFSANPRIVSVEPGSPAQRAGLEADDRVISIAGNDVTRPVPLAALLKPGARIVVRVERGGQRKDITVTVGKRPDDAPSPCEGLDDVLTASRWAPQISILRAPNPERSPRALPGSVIARMWSADSGRSPRQGFAFITPFAPAGNMIGGAQLLTLDAEWKETVGLDKGLLVLSVARGTPAEAAGLRKGDVIVAAGDSTLAAPVVLWRLFSQAGPSGLPLKVMRGRQPVTIVLRAGDPRR
jgi:serine protease Do